MHIYKGIITKVVILAGMLMLMASCAGMRPAGLQPVRGHVPDASTDELVAGVLLSGSAGLRSEVDAVLAGPDMEKLGKFSGALLMSPPRGIRLVLYDVFGSRVVDISLYDSKAIVYVPSEGTVYEGDIPMPWPSSGKLTHVRDSDGRHRLIEALPDRVPPASRMFIFDEKLQNVGTVIHSSGVPVLEAYYYDFESSIPMQMDFVLRGLYTFRLKLKEPEMGVDLPQSVFNNLPAETGDLKFLPLPEQAGQ